MLPNVNPTETSAWQELTQHFEAIREKHLLQFFEEDEQRFQKFSFRFKDILFDFSKNRVDEETLKLLVSLAQSATIGQGIQAMFSGKAINSTEKRAVLHTALRNFSDKPVEVNEVDVMPQVKEELEHIKSFAGRLQEGKVTGFTGKTINQIVNIGIGGSQLGPQMVAEALKPYAKPGLAIQFVSNIDGADIGETLRWLDPERTLFIIASKTFTTLETMTNAETARAWFLQQPEVEEKHISKHFVAVSTNENKVMQFGIDPANMFRFWDWVGGRYSLWSAIGLPVACYIGYDNFEALLNGAFEMDEHFRDSDLDKNIPVIAALISVWYNNFFGAETEAVLPYDHHLRYLPAYLQQLIMESNGKSVDRNGNPVDYHTGNIVWGEPGTNSQHSFFQLLHQGTKLVPADFIAAAEPNHPYHHHHTLLLSNFFAQTEALMKGKMATEVQDELKIAGLSDEEITKLLPYKVFEGNRPTTSILYRRLTPATLGSLLAFYEHKTFVQGLIWNIYSFDQWGVELGKVLARQVQNDLEKPTPATAHDSSTNGLINYWKELKEEQ